MNWFKQLLANNWIVSIYKSIKKERMYRNKLKAIKKRDPHIYK
jgi:hypothetical protein